MREIKLGKWNGSKVGEVCPFAWLRYVVRLGRYLGLLALGPFEGSLPPEAERVPMCRCRCRCMCISSTFTPTPITILFDAGNSAVDYK